MPSSRSQACTSSHTSRVTAVDMACMAQLEYGVPAHHLSQDAVLRASVRSMPVRGQLYSPARTSCARLPTPCSVPVKRRVPSASTFQIGPPDSPCAASQLHAQEYLAGKDLQTLGHAATTERHHSTAARQKELHNYNGRWAHSKKSISVVFSAIA